MAGISDRVRQEYASTKHKAAVKRNSNQKSTSKNAKKRKNKKKNTSKEKSTSLSIFKEINQIKKCVIQCQTKLAKLYSKGISDNKKLRDKSEKLLKKEEEKLVKLDKKQGSLIQKLSLKEKLTKKDKLAQVKLEKEIKACKKQIDSLKACLEETTKELEKFEAEQGASLKPTASAT